MAELTMDEAMNVTYGFVRLVEDSVAEHGSITPSWLHVEPTNPDLEPMHANVVPHGPHLAQIAYYLFAYYRDDPTAQLVFDLRHTNGHRSISRLTVQDLYELGKAGGDPWAGCN